MSQENVEAFKRAVEAGNRRDVEAILEELDPEVEWHPGMPAVLGGEATVYRGHEGVRELWRDLLESFAEMHVEYSEIRDLGDQSRTVRGFGFGPTSTPKKPSKPPGCRSSRGEFR